MMGKVTEIETEMAAAEREEYTHSLPLRIFVLE
jgi:hypothetical protein